MKNRTIFVALFSLMTLVACGGSKIVTPNPNPNPNPGPDPDDGGEVIGKYYISSSTGSDSNTGKSSRTAWKTLDRINRGTFVPGDSILLKAGDYWQGATVINSKFTGTAEAPIVLSSYGNGPKPRLSITPPTGGVILTINNSDYFHVENLQIGSGTGYGLVMGINDSKVHGNIVIKNVHTQDMPFTGIFFNSEANKNVDVVSCTSKNVEQLFAVAGGENINVRDCLAEDGVYGGFSITGVKGGSIDNCKVLRGGTGDRPNGACGIFLGFVDGFVISNTEVAYQKRQGTNPDGEAIDFECGNKNVTVKNCYMHNNAGCAIMFFDNARGIEFANENCVIEDCRFENNSRNCLTPNGFEIYFTSVFNNNNGAIRNNTFLLSSGVGFITTTDRSVSVSGNKTSTGTPLEQAPAYSGVPVVLNAGAELPRIGANFKHRPTGGLWTFRGNSGIVGNGSAFGAPIAPEGTQMLFLQGKADVTQLVALAAGTYKMTYSAAYRASSGSGQSVELYVDDVKIGEVSPESGNVFNSYESAVFTVEAGLRLIELRGIFNGDKSVFLDKISIVEVK